MEPRLKSVGIYSKCATPRVLVDVYTMQSIAAIDCIV